MKNFKKILVGSPLSTDMAAHERIPKWKALAVLSSDALSSVAYATEEILIPLSLFATSAMVYSIPIAIAITILIAVVTISYRQTIDAYPNGGGAYTVAKENLGANAGLVAGASLLIDYTLTVAVSVASGVENIASAFPSLLEHKEGLGILIIFVIMIFNLRGVKESANIFAIPTYLFVFSFALLILVGVWRVLFGEVTAVHPVVSEIYPEIPLFLLLRAFSSGCSALTGIEAISNGIPIFKEPAQINAKRTMLWMSIILGLLFLGNTMLAHVYGLHPSETETTISLLAKSVFGDSILYYLLQVATALILILAANTSFADFPRLSSLLAKDRYLPRQLASLGDRLVFSNGIIGLSLAAALLIMVFKGDAHHLIPLYAVGVFLSFSLSQLGMVFHHWKLKQNGWRKSLFFNLLGAFTTFVVLLVISITKFVTGAWMVILAIPIFVLIFKRIHDHYLDTAKKLSKFRREGVLAQVSSGKNIAIVPISGIHQGVFNAIQYALSISNDCRAVCVDIDHESTERLKAAWFKSFPEVKLEILASPYRSVIQPVEDYIDKARELAVDSVLTVIIPEFVTSRWYYQFLHNQTAIFLHAALRGKKNIVVTSIRYHL